MPVMNIAFQLQMTPALPTIYGPTDYRDFRATLENIDRILTVGGIESRFVHDDLKRCGISSPSEKDISIRRKMLRCNILRSITGLDFRECAMRLADSALFQWFGGYGRLGPIKTPSKSTLERFSKACEPSQIRTLVDHCIQAVQQSEMAKELLYRDAAISVEALFADSTCLKAPIHFPVDWVLLRDGVRSLVKAMVLIRREGLRHRMPCPESFLRAINSLCIAMSQSRRTQDAPKQRKKILRKMKKLAKLVAAHGLRYHDLLDEQWESTSWSRLQAECVLKRIENVLAKLPRAIKQAHERIIGERRVPSRDKLLSLYEEDIHVIVRGKANAEVEFGNGLYLVEQEDGLIVDWQFFREYPTADAHCVKESLQRTTAAFGPSQSYAADRGFWSKQNSELLAGEGVTNGICPRDPAQLATMQSDSQFVALQKRRAQTEGRIGILKNDYTGNPLNCRGYEHREKALAWSVLAHNLWTLGTMARKAHQEKEAVSLDKAA